MNPLRLLIIFISIALISACGLKRDMNAGEIKRIKKVAVVLYTVPEQIVRRSSPTKAPDNGLLGLAADIVEGNVGLNAANSAHKTFTETLNNQSLPFNVMSQSEMMSNQVFKALYVPPKPKHVRKEAKGVAGFLGGMLMDAITPPPEMQGIAPTNMMQYGLTVYASGSALTGKSGELNYIRKAIEALKVDAAILINDSGFSYSCEICIGDSGAASTGSAFTATMITREGSVILNMQEWFATTDAQAAMYSGIVNPLQQTSLFEEHGRKMAIVLADSLKEGMGSGK